MEELLLEEMYGCQGNLCR